MTTIKATAHLAGFAHRPARVRLTAQLLTAAIRERWDQGRAEARDRLAWDHDARRDQLRADRSTRLPNPMLPPGGMLH